MLLIKHKAIESNDHYFFLNFYLQLSYNYDYSQIII